jgi:hypothetical protein
LIAVVDQYEEGVAARENIPSQFVEWLSLLDRDREFSQSPWLFLWLTTSQPFQSMLEAATSRNRRILGAEGFQLQGPPRSDWVAIIEETFEAHNSGTALADYGVLPEDILTIGNSQRTLGTTMEGVGGVIAERLPMLQDLSAYQVIMLWPVTDGARINTVLRFVDGRKGYQLDWNSWYRQLGDADRMQLPLTAFNRARLYFDLRLVPIAAADLQPLCKDLDNDSDPLRKSYLERFEATHYVSLIRGTWDASRYSPLRERDSQRKQEARTWYNDVTSHPTKLGKRIALVLRELGVPSQHERDINSPYATVRADVLSERATGRQTQVITELKAFAPENTMPSTIRDQIRITLKRHAQFAGFLGRQ